MTKKKSVEPVAEVANRVGRPYKLEADDKTVATISGLAKIQCTNVEAAAVLGVSRETFEQFLGREIKAREAWENGKQSGIASLRRNQFRMSESNASMAIWLGKQYLKQKEPVQQVETGGPGSFDTMSDEELNAHIEAESRELAESRKSGKGKPATKH